VAEGSPGSVVTKPAGTVHDDRFAGSGARLFAVVIEERRRYRLSPRFWSWSFGDRAGRILLGVYAAVRQGRPGLGALVRRGLGELQHTMREPRAPDAQRVPGWLVEVSEEIHCGFAEPLRVRDLAARVGVHPVHLGRVFRETTGLTPLAFRRLCAG